MLARCCEVMNICFDIFFLFSFSGNGNGSTEEKPSAGLFAFGSANAKSSFGSFGSTTSSEVKASVSLNKVDETLPPPKPLTEFFKPKEADIKSDQDTSKKEKNWSCP